VRTPPAEETRTKSRRTPKKRLSETNKRKRSGPHSANQKARRDRLRLGKEETITERIKECCRPADAGKVKTRPLYEKSGGRSARGRKDVKAFRVDTCERTLASAFRSANRNTTSYRGTGSVIGAILKKKRPLRASSDESPRSQRIELNCPSIPIINRAKKTTLPASKRKSYQRQR